MSLLADLLARIKQPASKREVPPNLRNIVQASARQSGNRRKIILLACIFTAAVVSGLLLSHFGGSLMKTESSLTMPAGNVTAKADIQTQQKSEAPEAVSIPQAADVPKEAPVKQDTAAPDTENPATDEPVTVTAPIDKKPAPVPVQKDEEEKEPPVAQTASSAQGRTKIPTRQETTPKSDAFLYAARKYEMNNDYLNALSNYKHVLKTDADNFTVMNNISFMYLKLNLLDEAMTYAQMALDSNSDYVPALINMAIAHAQSGNYVDAERYLNHAGDLDPDNETILLNLAVLNERQENFSKALDLYSHLVKLGNSEGPMGEARIYEKQGNTQKAVELYRGISISESVDDTVKIKARQRAMILLQKRGQATLTHD
jgi:outer membrane biosynthesis protein TonB